MSWWFTFQVASTDIFTIKLMYPTRTREQTNCWNWHTSCSKPVWGTNLCFIDIRRLGLLKALNFPCARKRSFRNAIDNKDVLTSYYWFCYQFLQLVEHFLDKGAQYVLFTRSRKLKVETLIDMFTYSFKQFWIWVADPKQIQELNAVKN